MKNSGTSSASKTNRLKKDLALNNSISLSSFDNVYIIKEALNNSFNLKFFILVKFKKS